VQASLVGLDGQTANGLTFVEKGGLASWDDMGTP
jgi:hypothetical protein